MADGDRRVQVTIDGNAEGIIAAMQSAENAVQTQTRLISGHFSEMSSSINKVIGIVGTMSAVLAGGAMFKSFISDSQQWTGDTLKLAKALGTTTEEAGGLKVAAHNLGIEQDVLEGVAMRLSRTVATNQQAFSRLGIEVKDSHTGALLPMTQIIQNTIERLNEMEPGVNRNAAASLLFGRNWQQNSAILKLTSEKVAEGRRELQSLGLEVGPDRVQQFLQYRTEVKYLGLVSEALKVQVGNALMPVMINMGKWFHDVATVALFVFGGALKGIVTFVEYATLGVQILWETWKALWGQFSVTSISLVQIITQIISGDFAGAWKTAKQGVSDFASYGVKWVDNVAAAVDRTNTRVAKLHGLMGETARSVPQTSGAQFDPDKPEKDKDLSGKQIAAENARLQAVLAGFKSREQTIKEGNQSLILDEEFYYKTGIVSQTQFNDKKYEIERQGFINTKALIDQEIHAIRDSEAKKLSIANTPEEKGKVKADSGKEVTQKLAERQKLDAELYQLDAKYFTEQRVLALQDEKAEFDHTNVMLNLSHQLTQGKLKDDGDVRGAIEKQYNFESAQAAAQLNWTLAHTVLTEQQKARIQDEYRAKRMLAEQKYTQQITDLEKKEQQQKLSSTMQYTSATAGLFGSLYELSGKKLKAFFYLQQTANAASAVMSGYKSAAAATEPPPIGLGPVAGGPLAAIMIAGGYASAASIMAQSLGGVSGGGAGSASYGSGTPTSPVVTQPMGGQTQAQGGLTVNIQGNVIGEDSWVENNLIPSLNNALGRNVTLNIPRG